VDKKDTTFPGKPGKGLAEGLHPCKRRCRDHGRLAKVSLKTYIRVSVGAEFDDVRKIITMLGYM
jgi:hypothetical protein